MTSEQTTKYLRPNGDLTLAVGEQRQRFVVSRDVVMEVCKAWQLMFTKFAEATAPEVELPDDDPKGVILVLTIAHLAFDELPSTLSLSELNELATFCDKYDMISIIRPFLRLWVEPWIYGGEDQYLKDGHEQWLWIAWVFGFYDEFCALACQLQQTISINEDGKCFSKGGVVLDDVPMPPGFVDHILEIRDDCVQQLLKVCYTYINKVDQQSPSCTIAASSVANGCHAITLGSLMHGLRSLDLWKRRKASSEIKESIESLWRILRAIQIHTFQDTFAGTVVMHKNCNFGNETREEINAVVRDLPAPFTADHIDRLREHWEKRNVGHLDSETSGSDSSTSDVS